jgi:hypothetical protein
VLTDNGSCYRGLVHTLACRQLGIRHRRTRPTGRRQTGKPNASSAPCSPAGPTQRSTAQAANAPTPLTAGSGTTTIDADTQHSATNPRPPEPTSSGPTASGRCRRRRPPSERPGSAGRSRARSRPRTGFHKPSSRPR